MQRGRCGERGDKVRCCLPELLKVNGVMVYRVRVAEAEDFVDYCVALESPVLDPR